MACDKGGDPYNRDMERIRIPADLNEEDVFFSWGPIKMSMRQVVTSMGGIFLWVGVAKYFFAPLFGFSTFFAMFACGWIPVIGMALAFIKIRSRPIDVWVGQKLSFVFRPRTYILREPNSGHHTSVDTHGFSDDDIDVMLDYMERPKVIR